jgi:hypothetical protein
MTPPSITSCFRSDGNIFFAAVNYYPGGWQDDHVGQRLMDVVVRLFGDYAVSVIKISEK